MRACSVLILLALVCSVLASGPVEAVQVAHADILRVPKEVRSYVRYLWIKHLPSAKRKEYFQLLCGHLNGLSRLRRIERPVVVCLEESKLTDRDGLALPEKSWESALLLRINSESYGWNLKDSWEKLRPPHFHAIKIIPVEVLPSKPPIRKPPGNVRWEWVSYEQFYWGWRLSRDGGKTWEKYGEHKLFPMTQPDNPPVLPEEVTTPPQSTSPLTSPLSLGKDGQSHLLIQPWLPVSDLQALVAETGSDYPVVFADWFYYQTGMQHNNRAPGYYDFLGIKDQKTFHELVGFDEKLFKEKFAEFAREWRAVLGKSGISHQPRRIARFEKLGGGIWITFDNELAVGARNPLEVPDEGFLFDATEQIAHLPNGMLAFFLGNAEGVRQNAAPAFVGFDKTSTSNSGNIEVGLSCLRCHSNAGIQDVNDWYKRMYRPPLSISGPDYKRILNVQRLYFERMDVEIKKDRERFTLALFDATGLKPEAYSALVRKLWQDIADSNESVDLARASREYGVNKEKLQAALRFYKSVPGRGISTLDFYVPEEGRETSIPIEQYYFSYSIGQQALLLYGKEGKK